MLLTKHVRWLTLRLEDFLDHLGSVYQRGHYYMGTCPNHPDNTASLQVSEREDGSLGVFCQAGCDTSDVMRSLGLSMRDLFNDIQEEIVYTYQDENRRPLYDVIRKPGKEFPVRRYVGDTTEWGIGETRKVLYRLPDVLAADPETRRVWVVEGEKDAEAFWSRGLVATCNPGGAGKWQDSFSDIFTDRFVTIVQDKDDAGRKHAAQVMLALRSKAKEIRLVEARAGKDAFDHFAAGYDAEDFVEPSFFKPYDFTKPAPPVKWLFENYVAEGDLVLLAGKAKLGKSWLSMGLAVAIANGFGYFIGLKVKEGRVLYFDEENPEDVSHSRMVYSLGHKKQENLRYILHGGLRLDTHPELLMQEALLYQPDIVIVDSLAAVQFKEENSRSEMGEILRGVLKPLAQETGAGVLLIHHHDKQGYGPRGSGEIDAAVDSIINLRGTPGAGVFTMETQSRRRRSAHEKMLIRIVDVPGAGTRLEGNPIT